MPNKSNERWKLAAECGFEAWKEPDLYGIQEWIYIALMRWEKQLARLDEQNLGNTP